MKLPHMLGADGPPFDPFTPHLATPLGEFISFTGC